ncbi:MAG TPA: ParB/RepB/Spo0J family partition protein, partial [Planctomycetaceae bacterium]|nr:ParB/RepB/Spo0J family partition protein [Planctomycetaceae bacterium]
MGRDRAGQTVSEQSPNHDGAVDAVARSIQEFGFRVPLVLDPDFVIICGHTRWKAAKQLGLKKVPVHIAENLTPEQIRAYRVADNQTAAIADWDFDLLSIEVQGLRELDFDIDLLGFDSDELSRLLEPPLLDDEDSGADDIPEPPDEAITQPGDLWILGNHRLLCGDSSKPEDVDCLLDGAKIHLCSTDPPYNVRVEPRSNNAIAAGNSSFANPNKHHQKFDLERHPEKAKGTTKKMRAKDRPLENDFVSDEEFNRLLDAWFGNIARVLVPGRALYCWGGYANCANYPAALKRHGLYFSQAIIWVKEH